MKFLPYVVSMAVSLPTTIAFSSIGKYLFLSIIVYHSFLSLIIFSLQIAMIIKNIIASPIPSFPTLGDMFKIVKEPCDECSAVVIEADAKQDGVNLYIALDSDSYGHTSRPGNGGIRLLNYKTDQCAIDDAVRLAKGMTRKHDMFR